MLNLTNSTGVLQDYVSGLIKETVFPDNSFVSKFTNYSQYLNAKTVHLPFYTNQAGTISKNSTSFDYNNVTQSAQSQVSFSVDTYRVKPFQIENFEAEIIPFNKLEIEIRSNINALETYIADSILKTLGADVPAGNIIATSGAAGSNNNVNENANKKKIAFADIVALKKKMDQSNVKGERYLVVDAVTFSEILSDSTLSVYLNTGYIGAITDGTFPKIAGINIITRSTVLAMATDGTIKSPDAFFGDTIVDTDVRVSFGFIADCVGIAMSAPIVYLQTNVAQLYGSVMSAELYMGAKNLRQAGDKAGVYLIKQG